MSTAIGETTTGIDAAEETADTSTADAASAITPEEEPDAHVEPAVTRRWRPSARCARRVAYGVLASLMLLFACGAAYLKWDYESGRDDAAARTQSVSAATESTIALLSYQTDTVDAQLNAARNRLTGTFQDAYTHLIHDVVIPGAKQKRISAVATVPAAGAVSATAHHAVVMVFVDQSITVGTDAPTSTASSVKVTLDKVAGKWLISDFTPV